MRAWRRWIIAGAAAGAALWGAASAEPSVITNPDWVRRPSGEDFAVAYPMKALRVDLSGRAVIGCSVADDGTLKDCAVQSETPPGSGFGDAALLLSRKFRLKPFTERGAPTAGEKISIPISFRMAELAKLQKSVSWLTAPSIAEVTAAFPEAARASGATGKAAISCRFDDTGALTGCKVVTQAPRGQGIGAAVLKLANRFTAAPNLTEGDSIAGYSATIRFKFTPEMLDPAAGLLGKPLWAALPSAEQFTAAFPAAATKAGVMAARIVLAFTIQPDGSLGGCTVDSETPPDLGFGPAALGLSPLFRAQLWSDEGLPVIGGAIRLPIRFQIEAAPKTTPAPPLQP